MINEHALHQLNAFGRKRLADAVGVSPASITKWLQPYGRIPAERVLPIERVTGVSRHALRPDIYPIEDRAA